MLVAERIEDGVERQADVGPAEARRVERSVEDEPVGEGDEDGREGIGGKIDQFARARAGFDPLGEKLPTSGDDCSLKRRRSERTSARWAVAGS